jgi:hypothetical protein
MPGSCAASCEYRIRRFDYRSVFRTGTGTCTDVIFPKSACTIVLKQNNPGAGEITMHMAPMGTGKSYVFHIPLS